MVSADTAVKLRLLNDILMKKNDALTTILSISENQYVVLEQPRSPERAEMFAMMSEEKQKRIDEVLQCDAAFQSTFDGIKDSVQAASRDKSCAESVAALKTNIDEVLKLDTAIRAQEAKNRAALEAQGTVVKTAAKTTRPNPASKPKTGDPWRKKRLDDDKHTIDENV